MSPEPVINPEKIATLEEALLVIRFLLEENAKLRAENVELRERIARLEKNSQNSSKPPSSDITKPPHERRRPGKRKIGGQTGHQRHLRKLLPAEEVDEVAELRLERCPDCGNADLGPEVEDDVRIQQVV